MKTLTLSATLMLLAGFGWATSMPEAQPANGWLIALFATIGAYARAWRLAEKAAQA